MLKTSLPRPHQRGLVLVLALIVLAALSLAAVGLMRGVLSSNRVAGNLAFQQGSVQAADVGVERAVAWLEQQARATVPSPTAGANAPAVPSTRLNAHQAGSESDPMKYMATRGDPDPGQSLEAYWQALAGANGVNDIPRDANGNQVSFAIHRLCNSLGPPSGANCDASPELRTARNSSMSNTSGVKPPSAVYYRITVRVQGPRNATSFIQAVVAI